MRIEYPCIVRVSCENAKGAKGAIYPLRRLRLLRYLFTYFADFFYQPQSVQSGHNPRFTASAP